MVLGKKTSEVWVDYDLGDNEILPLKIRFLSKAKLEGFTKSSKDDDDELKKELLDYIIVDWKDVELDSGKPAECNLKNKTKVFDEIPDALWFIVGAAQQEQTFMMDAEDIKKKFVRLRSINTNGVVTKVKQAVGSASK